VSTRVWSKLFKRFRSRATIPYNFCKRPGASTRIPMVLCNAGYYGTLAAIRSLGRSGVPIVTVDPSILAPARYSRYSNLHLNSPPFEMTNLWADWLLRLGGSGPRRAIYATSDAVSFALALHREELTSVFDLYQPGIDAIISILDKGRLHQHAHAIGIPTPSTWLPESAVDAQKIIRAVGGTILIKPRSQLAVRAYQKGIVVDTDTTDGLAAYEFFLRRSAHEYEFTSRFPETMLPMVQRYHPEAMKAVYSLSGFRDVSGAHAVMLGAHKVLQHPREIGVGLCFEEADVAPKLAEQTLRLCERIGYYGAFELEFIFSNGEPLLIDFNGRFYNQLAFDIARGMDLPQLVYAAAVGELNEVRRLTAAFQTRSGNGGLAFCNSFGLSVTLATQKALRTISRGEAERWRSWRRAYDGRVVDAVRDAADPFPTFVDITQQLLQSMRHPRAFVREMRLAK
jgi:D-aspartate ligase